MHVNVIFYWLVGQLYLSLLLGLQPLLQTVLLADYPPRYLCALSPRTSCLIRTLPLCTVKSKKRSIIHYYLLYNI